MPVTFGATLASLVVAASLTGAVAADPKYYETEYGNMAKATRLDLVYNEKPLTFTAKTAATRSRVLVEASDDMAAKASSGIMRNLASGLIGRRLDPEPFRLEALKYLAQSRQEKMRDQKRRPSDRDPLRMGVRVQSRFAA